MTAGASDDIHGRQAAHLPEGAKLAFWIAVATGLSLLMVAPAIRNTLQGGFGDPDDALRLVEVRAWMSGQPWFDLTASRLDPPAGASMHWSRLVDVPNAALISLFSLFVDRAQAEAWDRIVFPTLLLAGLFAATARLAMVLVGRVAVPAALLGTLLCGVTLVQFQPGRIGHHAPETVALVFAVALALESIDPRHARRAAGAGALVSLAIAMSFETLPLLAALCAAVVLLWVVRGGSVAPMLRSFAAGFGLALVALFAASVPAPQWFAPVCDALGMAHLGAGLIFAAGTFALGLGSDRLRDIASRAGGAAAVANAALGFVALCYPVCLHSPFAGVDPLVREIWLDNVVESKPLIAFMYKLPMTGVAILVPTALGLVGIVIAALTTGGQRAQRFAVLAAVTAAGLVCGLQQVRVFASVGPLALCGGLVAVASLRERVAARGMTALAAVATAAILPFTSTAWALIMPPDSIASDGATASCLSPRALTPLSTLAPGRVVAPMDVGSHILASTKHSVFSAPYHRNNDGNRFALEVLLAAPDAAKPLLASRKVSYVLTCDGMGETDRLAAKAPGSLAAALKAGQIPDFLVPVALSGTPYRVYYVKPSS